MRSAPTTESATWCFTPEATFRGEDVAGRCLEELQHRLVLPRRRVRHIDDDIRAAERFAQPFAGDGVDARRGGGRHGLVAAPEQQGDQLFPDEPAATDYHDLHVGSP